MGDALEQFGKFISEQVMAQTKAHRDEMKSLDALRVRLVKENAEKFSAIIKQHKSKTKAKK